MRSEYWLASTVLIVSISAHSQPADDLDWLHGLPDSAADTSAQAPTTGATNVTTQMFGEVAFGVAHPRSSASGEGFSRRFANVSLDAYSQKRIGEDLRFVFSDRLNVAAEEHTDLTGDSATNALREAFLGYERGAVSLEAGRINLRSGVAIGYNPTDYFRSNAIIFRSTEDPIKLREMRLGVLALHGKVVGSDGSAALALAPKVTGGGTDSPFALRLRQTNDAWRIVAVASPNVDPLPYLGLSLLKRDGDPIRLGANTSAAMGRSVVAHLEWSGARQRPLIERARESLEGEDAGENEQHYRNQYSLGLSYTAPSRLNVALEYEYNGAGLPRAEWRQLSSDTSATRLYGEVLQYAQAQQEIPTRQAWMLRLNWPQFPIREAELTAIVRLNPYDHSRFAWIEGRYNRSATTFSLALTRNLGTPSSEYGGTAAATVLNASVQFYF